MEYGWEDSALAVGAVTPTSFCDVGGQQNKAGHITFGAALVHWNQKRYCILFKLSPPKSIGIFSLKDFSFL